MQIWFLVLDVKTNLMCSQSDMFILKKYVLAEMGILMKKLTQT